MEGSLGNFQLYDLTNYPKTLFQEDDWQKIQKNEIMGLQKSEHASSLITFCVKILNPQSP